MNFSLETFKSKLLIEKEPLFSLIFKASYQEANDLINEKRNNVNQVFYDKFLLDYAEAYIIFYQYGQEPRILNIATNLYNKSKEQEETVLLFKSIILLIEINRRMSNFTVVEKLFLEGEKIINESNDQMEIEYYTVELNYQRSSLLTRSGKIDHAINLLNNCISTSEKLENEYILMRSYNDIGICYGRNGNLDTAHEYFLKCLSVARKINSKFYIAGSNTNLAIIYQLKGELAEAFQFAEEGLKNNLTLNLQLYVSEDYLILGKIEYSFGNYNKTLEYYNKCLSIREKNSSDFFQAEILYYLIVFLCDVKNFDEAKDLLLKLEIINNKKAHPVIKQFYSISKAMILRYRPTFIDKGTAIQIFKEISNGDVVEDELSVFATLNLFELLLEEIKVYENESTLKELINLIEKLDRLATKRNSYSLIVQVLLLKSRFDMLDGDFSNSKELLEKALDLTIKKSMKYLKETVQNQLRLFANLEPSYKEFMQTNTNISDRSEFIGLNNVVGLIRKNQFGYSTTEQYQKLPTTELGLIIWKMTYLGPEPIGIDVPEELIPADQLNLIIPYSGALFTSVLGQGDAYHQGTFGPLPLPLRKGKDSIDALIASKIIRDTNQSDPRQKGNNYLVLSIIYPAHRQLARYELSKMLDTWWQSIIDVTYFNDLFLENLRNQLLENLTYIVH